MKKYLVPLKNILQNITDKREKESIRLYINICNEFTEKKIVPNDFLLLNLNKALSLYEDEKYER